MIDAHFTLGIVKAWFLIAGLIAAFWIWIFRR